MAVLTEDSQPTLEAGTLAFKSGSFEVDARSDGVTEGYGSSSESLRGKVNGNMDLIHHKIVRAL